MKIPKSTKSGYINMPENKMNKLLADKDPFEGIRILQIRHGLDYKQAKEYYKVWRTQLLKRRASEWTK